MRVSLIFCFALSASAYNYTQDASPWRLGRRAERQNQPQVGTSPNPVGETRIQAGQSSLNWGITYPWEALERFINDEDSPCQLYSCEGYIDDVVSYIANEYKPENYNGNNAPRYGTREVKLKISAEGHYPNVTYRNGIITAAMETLRTFNEARDVKWLEQRGKNMGQPIEHWQKENYNTKYLDVGLYQKDMSMIGWIDFDISIQEKDEMTGTFCDGAWPTYYLFGNLMSVLSKAVPLLGLFAGFFGAINAGCYISENQNQ